MFGLGSVIFVRRRLANAAEQTVLRVAVNTVI
jgi:hypothetical protein